MENEIPKIFLEPLFARKPTDLNFDNFINLFEISV